MDFSSCLVQCPEPHLEYSRTSAMEIFVTVVKDSIGEVRLGSKYNSELYLTDPNIN